MDAVCTHLAAVSCIIDVFRDKNRVGVARAERLELLEYAEEFGRDLGKVELDIDVDDRSEHLVRDLSGNKFVHPAGKFCQILFLHRKSCGIDVAPEIFKQIGTTLDSLI